MFVVSLIFSGSSFSQSRNLNVSAQNPNENKLLSHSNQSETNDLSKAILDKYKPRVLEHLFSNKTIASNISSNSSIPAAIVVGVITPNGIKYLHMVIFPKLTLHRLTEIQYLTLLPYQKHLLLLFWLI